MTKLQVATSSFAAALALAASSTLAQSTFQGDGTAYTLGQVGQGNCAFMDAPAAASQNYAAINQAQWNDMKNCGRCAKVSCDDAACPDTSISEIVYIVDRCPECKQGDLDLSPSVFKKITGSSPSRLKVKWQFVDCPGASKLQYCLKDGSNPYFVAIQPASAGTGIASMTINGKPTTMVDSAFYYVLNSQSPVDLSAVKVTLTSTSGATVEETVSLSVGSCTPAKSPFSGGGSAPAPAPPAATTAAPKPVTTKAPTPTTTAPATTTTPAATTATPKPATTTKAPTTKTPKPAPTTKAPTTKTPKPAPTTKAPTTKTPKPDVGADATEAPETNAPTTKTPTLTTEIPVTTKMPAPATPAPAANDNDDNDDNYDDNDNNDNDNDNDNDDNNDDTDDKDEVVSPTPTMKPVAPASTPAAPTAKPTKTKKPSKCASKFGRK